ncbi:hypothetical protein N7474_005795 [Penicillium riverlandense]|uniref:uncharacterized protein n=1 Tax=Penicillium riverlandense TaxID=1903569 RepID=UPI00254799DE|nr:uncharacterized protein N7474_005795 [Penicillium riverlandense]KAJ5820204.1 hypothetical protein N7474_005795 [Penicillium riverlandense]
MMPAPWLYATDGTRSYFNARIPEGYAHAYLTMGIICISLNYGGEIISLQKNPSKPTEEELRAREARRASRLDKFAARTEEEVTTEEEKRIQRLKDLNVDGDRPPRRFLFPTFITADVPISGQGYHAIPQSADLAGFAVMGSEERPSIHDESLIGEIPKIFLGKSAEEILAIFRESVRADDGERSFNAAYTFVIMDAQTKEDGTILICVDSEDFLYGESRAFGLLVSRNLIPFEMLVFNVDDIFEEGTILTEPSAEPDQGFRLPSPVKNRPSDES